jgi:hypothetical protein
MEIIDTYRKYKKFGIKPKVLESYSNGPDHILFNDDDKELDTIKVILPPTPDWNEIEGFGLPAKQQKFERTIIPSKIISLQEEQDKDGFFLTQDEIWGMMEEQPEYYKNEINFIKREWRRRLFGHWFFNNGVATYIDGWHYMYLNYYQLDIGLPEYRDRDRRFFHFARFCYRDEDCYGFIYPKHRREGATYKTSCIHYCIISLLIKARGGIQSMTDDSGKDVFQKHIIDPWRSMPFFFKPNHNGGDDPKALLAFRASSSRGKAGVKYKSGKSLGSEISFRSSNELAYDGTKLYFYHHEEVGKAKEIDVVERWEIVKPALHTGAGARVHGFSIHTSTVGEMEVGGGEKFKLLCDKSMYGQRDANGKTESGLYVLFIPAWDGLEGFIDEYGMTITENPTPEQQKLIKRDVGSKQFIENTIELLKKNPNKDGLLQFQRQHPTTYRGCFRSNSKDPFFDIQLIEDRLDEIQADPTMVTRGNFDWEGAKYMSKVRFIPDEKGRFEMSYQLSPDHSNRVSWDASIESFVAENVQYCAGADPFKANKTKSKKKSNGAGAVFWGHDIVKDPFEKPFVDWVSNRFVCTYSYRPDTKEEYGDDMIMMCVYWGCPMYPETNVPFIREHFEANGYAGMLIHRYEKGKYEATGGADTTEKSKQKIFQLYQTYIKRHCHKEKHAGLLKEIKDIKDVDDMTNWDLFTAGGYAMLGISNYLPDLQKQQKQDNEINYTFVQTYTYQV